MSRGLLHFPREVIRNIALHIYDPLDLTQQDRLSESLGPARPPPVPLQ